MRCSVLSLCLMRCASAQGAGALRRCQWPAGFGWPVHPTDTNLSVLAAALSQRDLDQGRQLQLSLTGVPHGEELSLLDIKLIRWTISCRMISWTPVIETEASSGAMTMVEAWPASQNQRIGLSSANCFPSRGVLDCWRTSISIGIIGNVIWLFTIENQLLLNY